MTREDLLRLAERCEREKPSMELDIAILEATTGAKLEKIDGFYGIRWPDKRLDPVGFVPKYTGSIDGATALLTTGMKWAAGTHGVRAVRYSAKVAADGYTATAQWPSSFGMSAALALCAAALRARAQEME